MRDLTDDATGRPHCAPQQSGGKADLGLWSRRRAILDRSALVAIELQKPEVGALLRRTNHAAYRTIGAATLLETGIVLSARNNGDASGIVTATGERRHGVMPTEDRPTGPVVRHCSEQRGRAV